VKLTGIGASAGVAIGPIYRFEREELSVRDTPVPPDRADAEVARFHEALERSRVDLEHSGWEAYGERAQESASSYNSGWDLVLGRYVDSVNA